MHLSTAGELAHPAEDGVRRASRHRDRIVTNGHGQTMEGYDRAMTDGRTETDGQKYERTETDGHHWHPSTAKVLNWRQRDAGGGS